MKNNYFLLILFQAFFIGAQSPWPSQTWSSAVNLTSVMDSNGVIELSGLHFNPINNRLYAVQDDGHLRVLQWNTATNTFSQLANRTIPGGPEGITQASLTANEFYTIDENNYEIRRYTHTANFSSVTLSKHWNLLADPSPMPDTGNTGPEGIVFVPDNFLTSSGFISQVTGQPYTSVKGMGGLFFIANQNQGYIWVFDVNSEVDDDFAYVGKYKTNRTESCDIALDRSTGLLYILHNIAGSNKLEVTDMETAALSGGERKFVINNEYSLPASPDDNDNVEGFALTPKCPQTGTVSAWLCRDVGSNEPDATKQDVLRWFKPFNSDGVCQPLADDAFDAVPEVAIVPNPASQSISISGKIKDASLQVINVLGQVVLEKSNINTGLVLDISALRNGIYVLRLNTGDHISNTKWIKN